MNFKLSYVLVALMSFLFACSTQPIDGDLSKSIPPNRISSYLNSLKTGGRQNDQKLDELLQSLDFEGLSSARTSSGTNLLILDVNSLSGVEQTSKIKAVFRTASDGQVAFGQLVTFEDNEPVHDGIVEQIFNSQFKADEYSGKISVYDITQRLQATTEVVNGKIKRSGIVIPKQKDLKGGRTKDCYDYYYILMSTDQDGHQEIVSATYLYSECEDPNTGGSGGPGGPVAPKPVFVGPSFPPNPQNGARYSLTESNGKLTEYIYNSKTHTWEILQITLPNAVVNANPSDYMNLALGGPVPNGYMALGPYDIMYIYDSFSASWRGAPLNGQNPPVKEYSNICDGLKDMWDNYQNNETHGFITADGKLIFTTILPIDGGEVPGLYHQPNTNDYYYVVPIGSWTPTQSYGNMSQTSSNYFIKVVATVHTHSRCRSLGGNGMAHPVGEDDATTASKYPQIRHWVIGCDAVGQFDGNNPNFFNVSSGPIANRCSVVF